MSWGQNKTRWSRLALAALLVTAAGSAGANVLVVRSSGPSAANYAPGRALADNARITLRAGDTLTLLDAHGTRTFRGPGNYSPGSAVQAAPQVASTGNDRRVRIGAVRSAGILPASPTTIWHVDVSQSGTMCLANPGNVMMWRSDASQPVTLAISGPGGAQSVNWPAGRATMAWPGSVPIADGAEYQLNQAGVAVPTHIRFRTLRSAPDDVQGVAQALIANGCQEQLDLLVDSSPPE